MRARSASPRTARASPSPGGPAGTRVPVGALVFAGLYGLRRLSGVRRHRLSFIMKDGTRLDWRSRPGEYESQKPNADRVVAFARSRGVLEDSRLVRE